MKTLTYVEAFPCTATLVGAIMKSHYSDVACPEMNDIIAAIDPPAYRLHYEARLHALRHGLRKDRWNRLLKGDTRDKRICEMFGNYYENLRITIKACAR